MDIIGIWNIVEVMTFDKDLNSVWMKKEDVLGDESADNDDLAESFNAKIAFCEDGFVRTLFEIPEEMQGQVEEMVAAGEAERYGDNYASMEKRPWKVEDGKIMVDTGMKAEVLGEELSSWAEVPVSDGIVQFLMFRLSRD